LSEAQQKGREHLNEFTEKVKEVFEKKLDSLEDQFKKLPVVMKQQVLLVSKMKDEISVKASEQFNAICSSLKVDSNKILEIEQKVK